MFKINLNEKMLINNAFSRKLKSERGVSILFALLVVLICTVIASIVITAASAAGGTKAEQEQMDQRYYSVLSATDLLRENLDGQELTVTKQKKTIVTTTTVITVDDNGDVVSTNTTDNSDNPEEYYMFTFDPPARASVILKDSMLNLAFGKNNAPTFGEWVQGKEAKACYYFPDSPPQGDEAGYTIPSWKSIERDLEMTTTDYKDSKTKQPVSFLDVSVKSDLKSDGTLYFDINNKSDEDSDYYRLRLKMSASMNVTESDGGTTTEQNVTTSGKTTTQVEKSTTVSNKVMKLKWTQGEVRKISNSN